LERKFRSRLGTGRRERGLAKERFQRLISPEGLPGTRGKESGELEEQKGEYRRGDNGFGSEYKKKCPGKTVGQRGKERLETGKRRWRSGGGSLL